MFWSKNKRKKLYPCKPQFYYIKVGCKGMFDTRTCFRDVGFFDKTTKAQYTVVRAVCQSKPCVSGDNLSDNLRI